MSKVSWNWRQVVALLAAFVAGVIARPLVLPSLGWARGILADAKDALQALQALVTSAGVLAGLAWFLRRRQAHPRVTLTHDITHRQVAEGRIWLRVTATAENKGNVLVRFSSAKTYIQQVVPPTGVIAESIQRGQSPILPDRTEIEWQALAECVAPPGTVELEPGETDAISWDFILSEKPRTIIAYTHLPNENKSRAGTPGWGVQTVYDLSTSEPVASLATAEEKTLGKTVEVHEGRTEQPGRNGNGGRPERGEASAGNSLCGRRLIGLRGSLLDG